MSEEKPAKVRFSPKSIEIMKIKFLFLGTVIGLLIGGVAIFIVSSMNKTQVMRDTTNYHPATFSVVEKFQCGCPKCDMELKLCYCYDAMGGIYEMYYISERLKEGRSENQVIKDVYKKFGKIKKQYQYLING